MTFRHVRKRAAIARPACAPARQQPGAGLHGFGHLPGHPLQRGTVDQPPDDRPRHRWVAHQRPAARAASRATNESYAGRSTSTFLADMQICPWRENAAKAAASTA